VGGVKSDGTFTASLGLVRVSGSVIAVPEGPDKGPGQEFRLPTSTISPCQTPI